MAKQRGTHQISGTINNLVYYQQKYVKGGLIRRQNEAMSNRLKDDPLFINTRAANALFGGCMMVSSSLLGVASRRLSIMTRPSRNAHLTASILRLYQNIHSTDKDRSVFLDEYDVSSLIESTDRLMKTPISRYFNSFGRYFKSLNEGDDIDIDFRASDLTTYASVCGVERVQIEFYGPFFIGPSDQDITSKKFLAPEVSGSRLVDTHTWNLGDGDLAISLTASANPYNRGFIFCTILPVIDGAGMIARFKIKNAIGGYIVLDYE